MSEDLRVTEIDITNFEQIENLTIRPGAVTIISGKNDSGKTSALNAVRSLFDLGHDPAFVRHGADKAIVKMTLSDGSTLTNLITKKGMDLKVRNAEGVVLPRPATLAKSMADGVSYDVMKFIRMAKKDRAAYLEKLMPMTVSSQEILKRIENRAFAPKVAAFLREPEYDLGALSVLRRKCYEDRTLANKDIQRLDGTIGTLRGVLPANWKVDDDLSGAVAEAEAKLTDLRDAKRDRREAAAAEASGMASEVDKRLAEDIQKLRDAAAAEKAAIAGQLEAARAKIDAEADPAINEAQSALGAIRQQAKDVERLRTAAADIDRHSKERKDAQMEVDVLEACMEAIDRAKAARLKETDIPGLSVAAGDVIYHKPGDDEPIPFDLHNQATQMLLAIKIGMLGAQRLPIIVFDGFESFDAEHRADLIERLGKSDFQVLAGRVADEPLRVETAA